jgi:hypothetical protein
MINSCLNRCSGRRGRRARYLKKNNFKHYYSTARLRSLVVGLFHKTPQFDSFARLAWAYRLILVIFNWQSTLAIWCRLNTVSHLVNLVRWHLRNMCLVGLERLPRRAGSKRMSFKHYYTLSNVYKSNMFACSFARYLFWRVRVFGVANRLLLFLLLIFMGYRRSFYLKVRQDTNKKIMHSNEFWRRLRTRRTSSMLAKRRSDA